MARYTGPKFKISRRAGINLTGATSPRLEQVIQLPPGGRVKRRKPTEYGVRLQAKQRAREQYGLIERQFRRFFERAQRMPGPTGLNLLILLERRLDNIVYRLGYARTRPMARQIVFHAHVPSYLVKPGDVVELTPGAQEIPVVKEEMVTTRGVTASWLERDGGTARVIAMPRREDADADIREDLIVEFYAR